MNETSEGAITDVEPRPKGSRPELTFDLSSRPTPEIVATAFLLITGRPLLNEAHLKKGMECGSVDLLREYLLNSHHFKRYKEQSEKRPFIFFIHIPKTGGGSLRRYLKMSFGKGNRQWFMKNIEGASERGVAVMRKGADLDIKKLLSENRISGGHIPFNQIPPELIEHDPVFISVLRDPVRRALSFYNFMRTERAGPANGSDTFREMKDRTLYELLTTNDRVRNAFDRIQMRFLCGRKDTEKLNEVIQSHRFILGKQEHMGDFVKLLHEMFGLPKLPSENQQVHKSSDYMTALVAQPGFDEAVEIIRKMNEEEYAFYNSFADSWTNMRPNFTLKKTRRERRSAPSTT